MPYTWHRSAWSVGTRSVAAGMCATAAIVAVLMAGLTAVKAQGVPAAPELKPLTFTEAQVTAGRRTFGSGCSGCHGEELGGLDGGPALKGPTFQRWLDGPVGALYDFVSTKMPADNPGTLSAMQYLNLVAFIASANGLKSGEVPLPAGADEQAQMGFSQPAP